MDSTQETQEQQENSQQEIDHSETATEQSHNNENTVSRAEFDTLETLVNDVSSTVSEIETSIASFLTGDKKEEETTQVEHHENVTPTTPDIEIKNPIEYMYVRKRGGRVVRREKKVKA